MTLPDIKDVGIIASFERWGYPYHGLAVGGVVPVSGHAIIQPAGGDTYVQRFANTPALGMTAPEIAADAALGRTWLDYAILAGSSQQLYGAKNLGPLGWIYGAADGSRWWVRVTSAGTVTGNSQTFTFSIKRFGEFFGTSEEYTRSVLVTDIGQSTPAAEFHSSIEAGSGGYDCVVDTYALYLEDIKPDGSHAVIGLRSSCPAGLLNWTPLWWAGEKVSMGFLSVTLSDGVTGPNVDVAVLYSRAVALGTVSVAADGGYLSTGRIIAVWFDDAGVPLPVTLGLDFPSNRVEYPVSCPGTGGGSASADHVWSFNWGPAAASYTAAITATTSGNCVLKEVAGGTSYVTTIDAHYSYGFEGLFSADSTWTVETFSANISFYGINDMRWTDGIGANATPANLYHGCGLFMLNSSGSGTYTGDEFMWAIKRISNKYFALLAMKFPAGTIYQTSAYSAWAQTKDMVWVGGFTPAGADGLGASLGVLANVVPSGSVQPVTHVPTLNPGGTPICYV